MDGATAGGLGGTFTGNPVACAAALAAIAFLEENRIPERADRIGEVVASEFRCFAEKFPFIGEARGLGAMRALELVKDRDSRAPDRERTNRVIRKACENGLLLIAAGTHGNVIRTLMPLVITDDELQEGLEVLDRALA